MNVAGLIAGVVLLVGGAFLSGWCLCEYMRDERSLTAVSKRRDDRQHQQE